MILSEKSLNLFNSLAVYEFSKYSSCFEVMNSINETALIEVFEVSPTPNGGILILASSNSEDLDLFYHSIVGKMPETLIHSCFLKSLNIEVVKAYLSQNSPENISNLHFFETNTLCEAFLYCQKIAESGSHIVDFRVIRSIHNRSIIIYSGDVIDQKSKTLNSPSLRVRSYFEVLK